MANHSKTYHTAIGNFSDEGGQVYVSDTVDRESIIVPAEFSKTGQAETLHFNPHTVILTEKDALSASSQLSGNANSAYLNGMSLLSIFANAAASKANDGIDMTEKAMVDTASGPSATQTTLQGSGFLQTTTRNPKEYLAEFAIVDSENLNLTEGQIAAWVPGVTAHELYHLKDENNYSRNILAGEIEADFGSLRDYFNKDYKDFVMDIRALRSLNLIRLEDGHATHIWSEEYERGLVPTDEEANEIMAAPREINAAMNRAIKKMNPELPIKEIVEMTKDPAHRYGALKALREQGKFDDISYGNEFVDKYIAAAERLYKPEYLAQSNLNEFRTMLSAKEAQPVTVPVLNIQVSL